MADRGFGYLNVAVEGCCHGELDNIYAAIQQAEARTGTKVDLLLICGDFESIRDENDLRHVAVPEKYRHMNTFHDYAAGRKVAPVTTIFIGGNHEASNFLHSLYYGGYVAPNIYFMGFAGVVSFGGIRIAGISGIYNYHHYRLGHYERPPYSYDMLKSIYHIRELEIYRLSHLYDLSNDIDVFLSHDWPQGIWEYGNQLELLRKKPFLRDDMQSGRLGAPPLMQLLKLLQPEFWFAAHLHVKFPAIVPHAPKENVVSTISVSAASIMAESDEQSLRKDGDPENSDSSMSPPPPPVLCTDTNQKTTRFVALDKVLPGREFLQFLRIPRRTEGDNVIRFDSTWLAVLRQTHHLQTAARGVQRLPATVKVPSAEDIAWVDARMKNISNSNNNDANVIPPIVAIDIGSKPPASNSPAQEGNEQTDRILELLELQHIWTATAITSQFDMSSYQQQFSSSSSAQSSGDVNPDNSTSTAATAAVSAAVCATSVQIPSDANELNIDDI